MRRSPPDSTTASMSAARLRGKNTTMSPFPEVSCDNPGKCTVPPEEGASGLIHAVIVPPAVAARTVPATRVKQMLPALDSTSIGPDTYMMRMPPPPVCARTEPRTSPKSICPPPVRTLTRLPAWPTVMLPPSVCKSARPPICPARMCPPPLRNDASRRRVPHIADANAAGADVAALRRQHRDTPDVPRLDVARFRLHLDAVITWHRYFELYPDLRTRQMG